jgi:hypothetical protein
LLEAFCRGYITETLGKLYEKEIKVAKIEKKNRKEKMNSSFNKKMIGISIFIY